MKALHFSNALFDRFNPDCIGKSCFSETYKGFFFWLDGVAGNSKFEDYPYRYEVELMVKNPLAFQSDWECFKRFGLSRLALEEIENEGHDALIIEDCNSAIVWRCDKIKILSATSNFFSLPKPECETKTTPF